MAKYIIQGETLKAIADEVRDLVDITDEINPNEMIANMEQVNADVAAQTEIIEQIKTALDGKAGSNAAEIGVIIDNSGVLDSTEGTVEEKVEQLIDKAEWEKLWYEASGKWIDNFNKLFANTDTDKVPKLNFENASNIDYLFIGTSIESVDYYINSSKITRLNGVFSACKKLKSIVGIDVSNCITAGDWLFNSTIEVIEKPLDFSKCTRFSQTFHNCSYLREIRFVPECLKVSVAIYSPALSAESIQSIIDGLATVETAQTLTLHKDVKAKLTQTQLDTITGKNWSLA
jgi:hypothetical protein